MLPALQAKILLGIQFGVRRDTAGLNFSSLGTSNPSNLAKQSIDAGVERIIMESGGIVQIVKAGGMRSLRSRELGGRRGVWRVLLILHL
jgi:hypothetical protein